MRNTRSVVPIRLSDNERKRIGRAAEARDLRFSSFVRWAALERAADELELAKPKPRPKPAVPERAPIVFVEPEPVHHFVEGICVRCNRDVDGRDSPCATSSS